MRRSGIPPRYTYGRYSGGTRQLFDLKRDPNQLESVHNDPEYAEVRRRLHVVLLSMLDCEGATCR